VTKTVDGMCADCWGVKDPARAKRWLVARRRQTFFDDPIDLLWLVGAVVAALLIVLVAASQWI
jgi:hypothetical protein